MRRLRRFRRGPWSWTLPRRAESWFEIHFHDHNIPGDFFRRQLRMNRDTFQALVGILGHRLHRENTRFRRCIPPEKVLALGLYRLAHGNSYVTIGPALNVGKSTVIEAVQDVVGALFELRDDYIHFPDTLAETAASIETFANLSDLPNIVGAFDGTHIRINAPNDSTVDYFSRYQQYDFSIQAVADGNMLFLDFSAGYPGSMHDSRMLRNSTLYDRAEQRNILTVPVVNVDNHDIGPYLVGDSAYPISPWLQKPFPEATRDRSEINFNKELSSARVKIECAFGCLKSRWRILSKRLDSNIAFSVKISIACAVLHNFCIKMGDNWDDNGARNHDGGGNNDDSVVRDGEEIRDILMSFI
ncbi:hypothetical protein QZH41_001931 [Actinostola sp. cb2023]|nr:hypothetical protein QZH41_001931 [Actinostola sp. cb2023]